MQIWYTSPQEHIPSTDSKVSSKKIHMLGMGTRARIQNDLSSQKTATFDESQVSNEYLANLVRQFWRRSARIVLESSSLLPASRLFISASYPPKFGCLKVIRQKIRLADSLWHHNSIVILAWEYASKSL